MWQTRKYDPNKRGSGNGLVAVAIDKDKGSQSALKWAAENLLSKGQVVVLIHVVHKHSSNAPSVGGSHAIICDPNNSGGSPHRQQLEKQTQDLFLTFHCFCTRKDILCLDIILEDSDTAKALTEYSSYAAIENLVMGSPAKHGFMRFKGSSTPSSVIKNAPDFCNVYVISKGKVSSARNSSRPVAYSSPLLSHIQNLTLTKETVKPVETPKARLSVRVGDRPTFRPRSLQDEGIRSPFARRPGIPPISPRFGFSESDTDISFISSDRTSTDRPSSAFYDYIDQGRISRISTSSDGSLRGPKFADLTSLHDVSFTMESGRTSCSWSSQGMDDVEAEMRRLKLELKQTMDMYSAACKEALTAKQKEKQASNWRVEDERKLEEARLAEEAAVATAEKEKARCRAAMEAAEAAKRIAALESQKRTKAEVKSLIEAKELRKMLDTLAHSDGRYRRYSVEEIEKATDYFSESRKIGEGGYGPVYKCYLDHTPVAVKVLRPDAAQGRSQFQQEIDILSCIRHPHMVLLLGACPEYGILVYEYMAKGSLDDNLFPRNGHTDQSIMSWQVRLRIASEIATGLLFLHQTKPEPLVHRDLKPGNILLDHNYVSKIGDVGLARLVPAVAENTTQYHVTSAAGTFCYIDPEYQQTGMLGVKSDVYSLGILLLQLVTAKPPMGLAHYVENSIERGTFKDMLDPAVKDWPVDEMICFARLALQCAELRRKDRPDLCSEVLPKLNMLRDFADGKTHHSSLSAEAKVLQQDEIDIHSSPDSFA